MQSLLLAFLLLIALGVFWRRVAPPSFPLEPFRQAISSVTIALFLPALCFRVMYQADLSLETVLVPVSAWSAMWASLAAATLVYGLWAKHLSRAEQGALILSATFGNVIYFGLPLLMAAYGPEAGKYAVFFDLFGHTPLLWTLGVLVAQHYGGTGERFHLPTALKSIAAQPPIWATLLGAMLNLLHVPLPGFLMEAVELAGSIVIPLMIFSIGLALCWPHPRHGPAILPAIAIKLGLSPLVAFGTAYAVGLRGTALSACLLEGAMPTMVLALLLSHRFGLDEELAALCIVVTTLLSLVLLPFLATLT